MIDFLKDMTVQATQDVVQLIVATLLTIVSGYVTFYVNKYLKTSFTRQQVLAMADADDLVDRAASTAVRAVEDIWKNAADSGIAEKWGDKLSHAAELTEHYMMTFGCRITLDESVIEDKVRAAYQREIGHLNVYASQLEAKAPGA